MKKQIQVAKEANPDPVNYKEKIANIHLIIDCLQNPNLSAHAKNDFLKEYIEKITYDVIDYGRSRGGQALLEVFLK